MKEYTEKKKKILSEKEVLLRLTTLCSQAEHCTFEMEEKMRKWDVDEQTQASVMEYLTKNRFVDDERYARLFVKDKIKYNKWGRKKVEQALWMKHIDGSIRQNVLDDIEEENYIPILKQLIESKKKTIKANSDYEMNNKLIRFALGRGFDMGVIRKCLDANGYDD